MDYTIIDAHAHLWLRQDTVLYNLYPTVEDKTIQNDTMEFIRTWLKKYFPETKFILVPEIKKNL